MSFTENLNKIQNSPRFRMANRILGAAALGITGYRFHKDRTIWNALPILRITIAIAETFKPPGE